MMQDQKKALDILKTKLDRAAQECERETLDAIISLQTQAKYDGIRFRIPYLKQVCNTLIQAITCKEYRFNIEISRVLNTLGCTLHQESLSAAQTIIENYFREENYLMRFDNFVQGLGRQAARHGLELNKEAYRVDLVSTQYICGVKNRCRQAIKSVYSELTLHAHTQLHSINTNIYNKENRDAIFEPKLSFWGFGINLKALYKFMKSKIQKNNDR